MADETPTLVNTTTVSPNNTAPTQDDELEAENQSIMIDLLIIAAVIASILLMLRLCMCYFDKAFSLDAGPPEETLGGSMQLTTNANNVRFGHGSSKGATAKGHTRLQDAGNLLTQSTINAFPTSMDGGNSHSRLNITPSPPSSSKELQGDSAGGSPPLTQV